MPRFKEAINNVVKYCNSCDKILKKNYVKNQIIAEFYNSGGYNSVSHEHLFNGMLCTGADLGFFKRESKILGSERCDVIVMTSPIR